MSRIGRKPIEIPPGVTVEVKEQTVQMKGPHGSLSWNVPRGLTVSVLDGSVLVKLEDENLKNGPALWGLTRSILKNMAIGVSQGYTKSLELHGVGFKAQITGTKLILNVGFSHPVTYPLPEQVQARIDKNVITVQGADKQLVGQVAAEIRSIRKPEPYKGKGIRYTGEVVRRKVGKVIKTTV